MNRKQPAAFMIAVLAALIGSTAYAQELPVTKPGKQTVVISDKVGNNQFRWYSDAPLEKITGTATGVDGTITFDSKNLSTLRGTISATVSTMKTGNSTRDKHLKDSQWLDASKYPKITFEVTSVSNLNVNGVTVTGTAQGKFTMHGVTKSMSIPFTMKWIKANAKTAERAPGDLMMLTAEFKVSLKDFNVSGTSGVVGSKVGNEIEVTANLFGHTQ